MEGMIRDLYADLIESMDMRTPYTCIHIVIISYSASLQEFDIHMLHEGAYVKQNVAPHLPFRGHPFCEHCKDAQLRFLLGTQGNLIQRWSNAQYAIRDLYTANLYSEGQLVVRSVPQFPLNRLDLRAPRASATLVKNIEAHIWKRQDYPSTGGPRKLILAPLHRLFNEVKETMEEAVMRLRPFIYLLVVDLYLRFLPEEEGDHNQVRIQYAPITVNPEDLSGFATIVVQDHLTLEEFVSRFVRNPVFRITCLLRNHGHNRIMPWPGFESTKVGDIYYELQKGLGDGSIPFESAQDGSLLYPIFQVHLFDESPLSWRWVS